MAKKLIDVFSDEFFKEVRHARNYPDAYDKATANFEKDHNFIAFDSYDSFRKKLGRNKKAR